MMQLQCLEEKWQDRIDTIDRLVLMQRMEGQAIISEGLQVQQQVGGKPGRVKCRHWLETEVQRW